MQKKNKIWQRISLLIVLPIFTAVQCNWLQIPSSLGITPAQIDTMESELYTGLPVGTVYYSHNHLGSGTLVTDANGNELFRITYDEYGQIDLEKSGKFNPATGLIEHDVDAAKIMITAVKYTGQEYDPETGLYYYNARYYDPQLGVFTSADTIVPDAKDALSYNRHMYVRGDPIQYDDPTGHCFIVCGIVGALVAVYEVVEKNDWDFKNNWDKIGKAAAAGFIGGATGGVVTNTVHSLVGGAAITGLSGLGTQTVSSAFGSMAGGYTRRVTEGLLENKNLENSLNDAADDFGNDFLRGGIGGSANFITRETFATFPQINPELWKTQDIMGENVITAGTLVGARIGALFKDQSKGWLKPAGTDSAPSENASANNIHANAFTSFQNNGSLAHSIPLAAKRRMGETLLMLNTSKTFASEPNAGRIPFSMRFNSKPVLLQKPMPHYPASMDP